MPGAVFSRLAPLIAYNYAFQALAGSIFVPLQTEKFYDACGALGYLSGAFISLNYPWIRARLWEGKNGIPFPGFAHHAPRQLLLTGAVVLWSARLGSYLFERIIKFGKDSRFDKVKYQPRKFFFYWMAQATWVTLVGLPVWIANAIPALTHPRLGGRDYAALALFAGSFILEVVADRQKAVWRQERDEKKHEEKFITRGLWSWSRHPNYVGEIGIWTGIWSLSATALTAAAPALLPRWTILATAASPLFTWFLLRKVSGVPLLEKACDQKFGGDPKWEEYKRTVPILFPWSGY